MPAALMGEIFAEVIGAPIPWQRPRSRGRGRGYRNTDRHELGLARVAAAVRRYGGQIDAGDPVEIGLDFIYPRPVRLWRRADPAARLPRCARPDIDNLEKLVLDGLERAGVLRDDSQIWSVIARKWYASISSRAPRVCETSRTLIRVRWGLGAIASDELLAVDWAQ